MNKCSRTACQKSIDDTRFYRIWNNPTDYPGYRDYCCDCGKSIITYNIKMLRNGDTTVELPFLIILPKFQNSP